jgi:hypothetical protein
MIIKGSLQSLSLSLSIFSLCDSNSNSNSNALLHWDIVFLRAR